MGRTRKNRERPTAFTKTAKQVAYLVEENEHFANMLMLELPDEKRRVVWCRLQDNKERLQRLRTRLRKLKRGGKPAAETPLFKFNGKEVK